MTDFPPISIIPGSIFKEGKPREMYADPDDVQSLIRRLLYANDLKIEGLDAAMKIVSFPAPGIVAEKDFLFKPMKPLPEVTFCDS
jgi:hypothetical protein